MNISEIKISENQKRLFWEKVDKSGMCWVWTGAISPDGYGKYSIRNGKLIKTFRAHRMSYFLTYGYINDNLLACHKCDNPLCVNPEHIFLGSFKNNNDDSIAKGRQKRAQWQDKSKNLKNEDVIEIKRLLKSGVSQINIAKRYNVGRNCIWHIAHETTWKGL
jgi:hypothetical protein